MPSDENKTQKTSMKYLPSLLVVLVVMAGFFLWRTYQKNELTRVSAWIQSSLQSKLTTAYPDVTITVGDVGLFKISDEVYEGRVETTVHRKEDASEARKVVLDLKVRCNEGEWEYDLANPQQLSEYNRTAGEFMQDVMSAVKKGWNKSAEEVQQGIQEFKDKFSADKK